MGEPLAVGVLASGEGTTLDGLAAAIASDRGSVRIVLVVSDRPDARALERARYRGIPTSVRPYLAGEPERWAESVTADLEARGVGLVVLAGFLAILPDRWVEHWRGRAINLHPSLLPRYGGLGMHGRRVHAAVLAAGDRETGVTVHLVTGEVDGGPTIDQRRLAVLPTDTPESLRDRLRPLELELLVATVRRFADGTLPLPYRFDGGSTRGARAAPRRRAGAAPPE